MYKAKIRVKGKRQSGSGRIGKGEQVKKEKVEDDLFAVEEEGVEGINPIEKSELKDGSGIDPEIKAYGKAWGVLFWNGE